MDFPSDENERVNLVFEREAAGLRRNLRVVLQEEKNAGVDGFLMIEYSGDSETPGIVLFLWYPYNPALHKKRKTFKEENQTRLAELTSQESEVLSHIVEVLLGDTLEAQDLGFEDGEHQYLLNLKPIEIPANQS